MSMSSDGDGSPEADEAAFDAANALARAEDEALEAQFSTPAETEDDENGINMVVENVVSALKRTRDEVEDVFNGDSSVARRLFQEQNKEDEDDASEGSYHGIRPFPLPDDYDPEL